MQKGVHLKRGSSIVMWSVTFVVLLASISLLQIFIKRPLQLKVVGVTDYLFWRQWVDTAGNRQEPLQYKGDKNSASKGDSSTSYNTSHHEFNNTLANEAVSSENDTSKSSAVADGSELLLKSFDLNQTVY